MGEAKQKLQALKDTVLKFIERWDFPPSIEEAKAVEEIRKLPVIVVRRYPWETLARMRMKPNECHANAEFMEDNDPEGKCKKLSGYVLQSGHYVLHSVVEREGQVFCVTPMAVGGSDEFPFTPDPDIEWRVEGDNRDAYRKGVKVGVGFRSDPAESKRISGIVLARMKAGMHPLKAGEPPF